MLPRRRKADDTVSEVDGIPRRSRCCDDHAGPGISDWRGNRRLVRAHARMCRHGLGRRDVPVPLGDGDRRKADGVAVICISYRTLRTLLGLVIVLLAPLTGLAVVSWAGEPPRDCCRDLGAVP